MAPSRAVKPGRAMPAFGLPIHDATMAETLGWIRARLAAGVFTNHMVINVSLVVAAVRDPTLRRAIRRSDLVNIDGMGVVWGMRALGWSVRERVAGIDLFTNLLRVCAAEGRSVFFLGASPEVLAASVAQVQRDFPTLRIAGTHHGYFKDETLVVEAIQKSGADCLFVAMGSPFKEVFLERWGPRLGVRFALPIGGSLDVVAGKVRRAPLWMQRCGLEWLFRLLQEPRRLLWRYVSTNLAFLGLVIAESVKGRRRRRPTPGK